MTQQQILSIIENLPTKQQIEKEAGLSAGYLSKKNKNWSKKTTEKIVKALKNLSEIHGNIPGD